jgi:hypothetical protein
MQDPVVWLSSRDTHVGSTWQIIFATTIAMVSIHLHPDTHNSNTVSSSPQRLFMKLFMLSVCCNEAICISRTYELTAWRPNGVIARSILCLVTSSTRRIGPGQALIFSCAKYGLIEIKLTRPVVKGTPMCLCRISRSDFARTYGI